MKIIVLQGMPHRGKTTTLNRVWDIICNENAGNSTNRQPLGGDPNDFSDIVLFNGVKIAFYTMGDYSNPLANAVRNYAGENCDIMICALSLNPPKVRANNAINRFQNTRINKTIANTSLSERQANEMDAQTIFGLL